MIHRHAQVMYSCCTHITFARVRKMLKKSQERKRCQLTPQNYVWLEVQQKLQVCVKRTSFFCVLHLGFFTTLCQLESKSFSLLTIKDSEKCSWQSKGDNKHCLWCLASQSKFWPWLAGISCSRRHEIKMLLYSQRSALCASQLVSSAHEIIFLWKVSQAFAMCLFFRA